MTMSNKQNDKGQSTRHKETSQGVSNNITSPSQQQTGIEGTSIPEAIRLREGHSAMTSLQEDKNEIMVVADTQEEEDRMFPKYTFPTNM